MKIMTNKNAQQATHNIANKGFASQSSLRSVQWYAKGCGPLQS